MRTYGSQEDQQVQMHRATLQHAEHPFVEAAAPLDVNAMKARWDSLDEMESGGEEEEVRKTYIRLDLIVDLVRPLPSADGHQVYH